MKLNCKENVFFIKPDEMLIKLQNEPEFVSVTENSGSWQVGFADAVLLKLAYIGSHNNLCC